jgi:hypothetical protein
VKARNGRRPHARNTGMHCESARNRTVPPETEAKSACPSSGAPSSFRNPVLRARGSIETPCGRPSALGPAAPLGTPTDLPLPSLGCQSPRASSPSCRPRHPAGGPHKRTHRSSASDTPPGGPTRETVCGTARTLARWGAQLRFQPTTIDSPAPLREPPSLLPRARLDARELSSLCCRCRRCRCCCRCRCHAVRGGHRGGLPPSC